MTDLESLVRSKGRLFSDELGIDVVRTPFRWLLAAMLFGRRINQTNARNTYAAFARRRLLTPQAILRAGRDVLIVVMGECGYVRYDNMMSDYVIGACRKLVDEYGGKIEAVHARAQSSTNLQAQLLEFKGIGPVTLSIFLRELRGVWERADPPLTQVQLLAARALGFSKSTDPQRVLKDLKGLWARSPVPGYDFRHLEAALVRTGLELRQSGRKQARRSNSCRPL